MFKNGFFDDWLDKKSNEIIEKIGAGKEIKSEEMIILLLKAQTNHFHHLDAEIRDEINEVKDNINSKFEITDQKIILLREEMDKRFEESDKKLQLLREEMDKRFEESDKKLQLFKEDMDKRFEEVDRRFEQVDRRFEQVDRRFDDMLKRLDRFMFWSLGLVSASTFLIIKFLS
jgi:hypothetical protein